MSRRTLSSIVAFGLLLVLGAVAVLVPVPYVIFSPGPTVDILAQRQGHEIVSVNGHRAFHDQGQIRLVTVSVTSPTQHVDLFSAMGAWFDSHRALYPRDVIYPPGDSQQQIHQESSVQMVSSQDVAVASALRELGYHLPQVTEVYAVSQGSPADGALEVRDQIVAIDGHQVTGTSQVGRLVRQAGIGHRVKVTVRRDGKKHDVPITTESSTQGGHKHAAIGIVLGAGYDYPFHVSVDISDNIGGPSAGLMFSLAVYDTLTPGSLTHGGVVAGTGTINGKGKVGPIGGIQQKIVGARASGAKLFFVPPGNCAEARSADAGAMRLIKAPTMHSALTSLKAWSTNHQATLPSCG